MSVIANVNHIERTPKPRKVRNTWIKVCNGTARKEPVETGPIGDKGGMTTFQAFRENGEISKTQLVTQTFVVNQGKQIRIVVSEVTETDNGTISRTVYSRYFDR